MPYSYSVPVVSRFFTALTTAMEVGGSPSLVVKNLEGVVLCTLPFPIPLEKSRAGRLLVLNNPPPAMVMVDGEAGYADILDGMGGLVVSFGVGSETVNPTAELIISSTTLYAGGMIIINKLEIKA